MIRSQALQILFHKTSVDLNVEAMILVTPTWQTQLWHTLLLKMSIQRLLLLPALPNLLLNPQRKKQVSGVENYGKTLEIEGILSSAAKLIFMSRRGLTAPYELAETSGLAGVVDNKLIQFVPL